jgi:hypothetical protein
VYGWDFDTSLNAQAAVPSLLRALAEYGQETADILNNTPFTQLAFHLGRGHPLHEALGPELSPVYEPPYAWYVRVPDVPRFLRHIAPVLHRRLAASVAAGYNGELTINFYRGGIRLLFEQGYLASAYPLWANGRRRLSPTPLPPTPLRLSQPGRPAGHLPRRVGQRQSHHLA